MFLIAFISFLTTSYKKAPPRELTEEEKQQILHSEEFLIFFDRTIRVIERALAEDSDIFFDYSGRELEEKDGLVSRVHFLKNKQTKTKTTTTKNNDRLSVDFKFVYILSR